MLCEVLQESIADSWKERTPTFTKKYLPGGWGGQAVVDPYDVRLIQWRTFK